MVYCRRRCCSEHHWTCHVVRVDEYLSMSRSSARRRRVRSYEKKETWACPGEEEAPTPALQLTWPMIRIVVRPLEWSPPYDDDCGNSFTTAKTPFGNFRISWTERKQQARYVEIVATPWGPDMAEASSIDEAKALCWNRYELAVLACLREETT